MKFLNSRLTKGVVLAVVLMFTINAAACDKLRKAREATHQIEVVTDQGLTALEDMNAKGQITLTQEQIVVSYMKDVTSANKELISIVRSAGKYTTEVRDKVLAQLQVVVRTVGRLNTAGVLHIKNPNAKIVFDQIVKSLNAALETLKEVL